MKFCKKNSKNKRFPLILAVFTQSNKTGTPDPKSQNRKKFRILIHPHAV